MTRRLHVACFVYEFPALSETFVLNQLTGLLDAGHELTVFAERRRPGEGEHADVARYGLAERTVYLDLPDDRAGRAVRAVPILLRQLARRPRAALAALDVSRWGDNARSLRLLYWLERIGGTRRFDVVHCHFGINGRTAAQLRELGALRGPLVTTFHGVDVSAVLHDRRGYYDHLFRVGDAFLAISERWRRSLAAAGCDPARLAVHRMGVDLRRFPFAPAVPRPGEALRVLGVGRLVEKKGFADGLDAVAGLARDGVPFRYDIVGDGPLRVALAERARGLGIADRVTFHGWLGQDAVSRLMRVSHVLLAPSVTDSAGDQEGIPVTLMEAMACGLPVVSTRHSGIPELVEDGRSGRLVEEHDVAALTAALARVAQDAADLRRMAENARARIASAFDVAVLNRDLVARFESLSGGAAVRPARPDGRRRPRAAVPS